MRDDHNRTGTSGLIERCLEVAVDHLTRQSGPGLNVLAARTARDAARLLGYPFFAAEMDAFLNRRTEADLLCGAITNIQKSEGVNCGQVSRRSPDEIERDYPRFDDSYVLRLLSSGGDHLRRCLERDYEAAIAAVKCDTEAVEVSLAQLVLGDFDAARLSLQRFRGREEDMQVVMAIELHRRDRLDEAKYICSTLLDLEPVWAPINLALGFSGRVPWPRYPFPDF